MSKRVKLKSELSFQKTVLPSTEVGRIKMRKTHLQMGGYELISRAACWDFMFVYSSKSVSDKNHLQIFYVIIKLNICKISLALYKASL